MWVPRGPRRTAPHGGSLGISRGGVPHRAWKGISIPCLPPSRLGESTSLGGERSGSGEGGPPACGSKAGPHERGTEWDRRPVQGSISRSLHTGRALAPGVWGPEDSTPGPRQTQEHLAGQQELGGHATLLKGLRPVSPTGRATGTGKSPSATEVDSGGTGSHAAHTEARCALLLLIRARAPSAGSYHLPENPGCISFIPLPTPPPSLGLRPCADVGLPGTLHPNMFIGQVTFFFKGKKKLAVLRVENFQVSEPVNSATGRKYL
ncbi:uncharacterized protein LOC120588773 [Pteropus medius]|uniref:uncharacterized protein LOC120588773 n=1 Tax=Pteropus vampyrus TaxID=132908 RepID=UPI00196B61AC|nr:uncharacterized protein LOC120588773 [Pteropus giganteus]